MKKTKIIATIGPSCTNKNKIKNMILDGMNVARINMSHQYDLEDLKGVKHKKIKKVLEGFNQSLLKNTYKITSNLFGLRHGYPTTLFYLLILQVVCPFFFYQMVLG